MEVFSRLHSRSREMLDRVGWRMRMLGALSPVVGVSRSGSDTQGAEAERRGHLERVLQAIGLLRDRRPASAGLACAFCRA
jgi:hypothetical protein